ncbi:MAG: DNA translocase FtsK 4TM domain-containing protein, partial [Algoriphagus sp.]
MASESPKTNTFRKKAENAPKASTEPKKPSFSFGKIETKQVGITFGIILISISIFLVVAFASYLMNGPQDQSLVMNNTDQAVRDAAKESKNWLGYLGAQAAHWMIFRWFGVAAFLFPPFLFLLGFRWTFKLSLYSLTRYALFALFFTAWIGLVTGYAGMLVDGYSNWSFLSGGLGYELARLSYDFLGMGTWILIAGTFFIFIILFYGIQQLNWFAPKPKISDGLDLDEEFGSGIPSPFETKDPEEEEFDDDGSEWEVKSDDPNLPTAGDKVDFSLAEELVAPIVPPLPISDDLEEDLFDVPQVNLLEDENETVLLKDGNFTVQKGPEEEKTAEEVENLDPYDPTLDLPRYKYPTIDLLNEYDVKKVTVSRQELEENKDKIVTTLENFQIGIQGIQATIGPTVTLYEIVPNPGVKISKIKNLEDDIALSLAALGIR